MARIHSKHSTRQNCHSLHRVQSVHINLIGFHGLNPYPEHHPWVLSGPTSFWSWTSFRSRRMDPLQRVGNHPQAYSVLVIQLKLQTLKFVSLLLSGEGHRRPREEKELHFRNGRPGPSGRGRGGVGSSLLNSGPRRRRRRRVSTPEQPRARTRTSNCRRWRPRGVPRRRTVCQPECRRTSGDSVTVTVAEYACFSSQGLSQNTPAMPSLP